MALFGFGKKKKDAPAQTCCCGGTCTAESHEVESAIKVLGSGCAKCNELEKATVAALKNLGIDEPIEHVTDFSKIASFGVMSTPALVVDGKVLSYGKVLKVGEVEDLIKKARM